MEPWQVKGVSFNTESKFWSFVRSGLRKVWARHQVKLKFIDTFRIKVPNPNPDGRVEKVWGMTCVECGQDYPMPVSKDVKKKIEKFTGKPFNYIEINHKTEAGSLKSKEDIGRFAANLLYVTFDDLEPMCKECHAVLTYMQKEGVDKKTATAEKQAIALCRDKADVEWLESKGLVPEKSSPKRRKQIVEYLLNGS
jgi:RNase P subunit RPR2